MKKCLGVLLAVVVAVNSVLIEMPLDINAESTDENVKEIIENIVSVENEDICDDALVLIKKMVDAENSHNWDEYPKYWRREHCEFFEASLQNEAYLKNKTGVSDIKSAKVVMCEKVTDSSQVDLSDYTSYEDVQVYLVGIDYEVYETQESFYNGVNYRYYIIGKENGKYKTLDITEAQLDYLEDVVSDEEDGIEVFESKAHTKDNLKIAIKNRKERIEDGKIFDSCEVVEQESYNKDSKQTEYNNNIANIMYYLNYNNLYTTCGSWRGSHIATTKCTCSRAARKLKIHISYNANKALDDDNDGIIQVSKKAYLRNVLFCEMQVSGSNNEEALKAVMVCIQEYALWNMRYFAKYPNMGYDVKDTAADQKFIYGTYASNLQIYREKVDAVYDVVKDVHIHTGSNSSLFETGYVKNSSYDTDSYGTLYQERAVSLSKQGYTYKAILRDAYNNTSQMGISNIGTIRFSTFQ